MARLVCVLIVAIATCGCVSTFDNVSSRHAIINDVTVRDPYLADYCVQAVDGEPVQRVSSPVATMVPLAIAEPGEHTLTIGKSHVTAYFESGKSYRIKKENDALSVVEKAD